MDKFVQLFFFYPKHEVSRAIDQLSPLEIPPPPDTDVDEQPPVTDAQNSKHEESSRQKSMRAAAIQARHRIAKYSSEEVATIMFSFPPGSVVERW